MATTFCNIDGKSFRIDYERTQITSGILYHGTLFQQRILEFFFVLFANGDPVLFSPQETGEPIRTAIINSIQEFEKSENPANKK